MTTGWFDRTGESSVSKECEFSGRENVLPV